jgi:hypothetical protein
MLKINKYGLEIRLKIFNLYFNIHTYIKPRIVRTIGIRNNTLDGKRLVFLDYDNTLLDEMLIPELQYFQKKYELSNFYIFKSSNKPNSYHAICLDKLNPNELMQLLIESGCDERYKTLALSDLKSWVLRFGKKGLINPEIIKVIVSPSNNRQKSKTHALFLHYQYGLNTKNLNNLDDNEVLPIVAYETLSNIDGGA